MLVPNQGLFGPWLKEAKEMVLQLKTPINIHKRHITGLFVAKHPMQTRTFLTNKKNKTLYTCSPYYRNVENRFAKANVNGVKPQLGILYHEGFCDIGLHLEATRLHLSILNKISTKSLYSKYFLKQEFVNISRTLDI